MKKLIIPITILLFISGCVLDPFSGKDKPPDSPIVYDYDSLSAAMAVWYFETLFPNDAMAQKIYNDINLINSQWEDSVTIWSDWMHGPGNASLHPDFSVKLLEFIPPYKMSIINFRVDNIIADPFVNGTHLQFNAVLDSIQYDSIVWSDIVVFPGNRTGNLYLSGIQNPLIIARKFTHIDELDINLRPVIEVGGFSNIYPYLNNGNSKYFYSFAWGDCPAGCIYSYTFYFDVQNGKAILRDIYDTEYFPNDRPPWVDTLVMSIQKWRYRWWEEL